MGPLCDGFQPFGLVALSSDVQVKEAGEPAGMEAWVWAGVAPSRQMKSGDEKDVERRGPSSGVVVVQPMVGGAELRRVEE